MNKRFLLEVFDYNTTKGLRNLDALMEWMFEDNKKRTSKVDSVSICVKETNEVGEKSCQLEMYVLTGFDEHGMREHEDLLRVRRQSPRKSLNQLRCEVYNRVLKEINDAMMEQS